jgi:hypothetical protein
MAKITGKEAMMSPQAQYGTLSPMQAAKFAKSGASGMMSPHYDQIDEVEEDHALQHEGMGETKIDELDDSPSRVQELDKYINLLQN